MATRKNSFEGSPGTEREYILEQIKEREPKVKPRLTFPFSLSLERREALEQVYETNPDINEIIRLMGSEDIVISMVALELLSKIKIIPPERQQELALVLRNIAIEPNTTSDMRIIAINVLEKCGKCAIPIIKESIPLLEGVSRASAIRASDVVFRLEIKHSAGGSLDKGPATIQGKVDGDLSNKRSAKIKMAATQKALFATPYQEELVDRIGEIEEVVSDLLTDGSGIIGIVVNGSVSKGYFSPESDIDLSIIGYDYSKMIYKCGELQKRINARICDFTIEYITIKNDQPIRHRPSSSRMFSGLFFGNFEELTRIQAQLISNMSQEEWEDIRRTVLVNETNIRKLSERVNISPEDYITTRRAIALMRVPPPYEETKKLLEKRARKIEEKKRKNGNDDATEAN